MPVQGFIINLIDQLTLLLLVLTIGFLLYKKSWHNKIMTCIMVNSIYSIFQILLPRIYPVSSSQNDIITNFTMHIDTLSGFCFFYYLWIDTRYRKFLVFSITPVLLTWLLTFVFARDLKIHFWNLLLPSIWFFIVAQYAMLLMYRKSSFQDTASYVSRFLLIAGFLFYNFIYLILEICYLKFTSISNITDAWNINYWSYLIFRAMIFGGVLTWYSRKNYSQGNLMAVRK